MKIHWYELIHRPISPGCFPRSGHVTNEFDHVNRNGFRFGAVAYQRELSADECYNYDLESIEPPRDLHKEEYLFIKGELS